MTHTIVMTPDERVIVRIFLTAIIQYVDKQYTDDDECVDGEALKGNVIFEHAYMSAGEHLMSMLASYGVVEPDRSCIILTKFGADLVNRG